MKYLYFFLCTLFSLSLQAESKIHEKVLICAVCKNVAPTLSKTIPLVEMMGKLFDDYVVLIYENNSTDETPKLLQEWSQKNPKVVVTSEKISQEELTKECVNLTIQGTFNRSELIGRARNIVLQKALSQNYAEFPYLIWFDLDFEYPFSTDGIVEVFESKRDWDAVMTYSTDPKGDYFDWYAYRDKTHPIGAELYGNAWWTHVKKELKLSPKDDWYPVISAFGGLGIYKKASIQGCSYSGIVTPDLEIVATQILFNPENQTNPDVKHYFKQLKTTNHIVKIFHPTSSLPILDTDIAVAITNNPESLTFRMNSGVAQFPSVCEHVTFHASMIAKGHDKLFINPRLVLKYASRDEAPPKEKKKGKLKKKKKKKVFQVQESPKPTSFIWNKGIALLADSSSHIFDIGFSSSDYKNIQSGDVVWVRSGNLIEFVNEALPHIKVPFILITGDGDEGVPFFFRNNKQVMNLLSDDRIIHWFTQNYDTDKTHPKLSPLPIGIDFHSLHFSPYFKEKDTVSASNQEKILGKILEELLPTNERIPRIFADFHFHDTAKTGFNNNFIRFGESRKEIKKLLKKTNLVDFQKKFSKRTSLWKEKGKYAFSVSPIGNGLDCHRTWEDLALGCIVIVKSSPIDPLFEGLPVVIVRDWDEITEKNLSLWLKQYGDAFTNPIYREKLTNAYWMKKIHAIKS